MGDDADFPELPSHIHYLVKDREYGLECRRCGAKGPSSYFKTFACPFQDKIDAPNNPPLQQTAARETPKESVEDVASGSSGTGDATTPCPSKDKGNGPEDGTGNDVEKLEDLEVEILQLELLQQQLDELELEELEQHMKELSMQEFMLEHELEMADQVDYGDKPPRFDPCAKMPGVPQIVAYGALNPQPQDKDSAKEKEDCEEKRDEKSQQKSEEKSDKEDPTLAHVEEKPEVRPQPSPCRASKAQSPLSAPCWSGWLCANGPSLLSCNFGNCFPM